jgi:long-subunit fatty acid transport protein
MDMSENFAIGAAMHFYSGSSRYSLDFVQDDTDDLYSVFPADYDRYELTQEIQSGFGGWGVKAGGLFKMNKNLRVGISAEFPSSLSVKETYSENDALTFDGGTVSTEDLGSGNWEYRIRYPFKLGAGVCLDLDRLCLTGGMEYRDWTQVRFEAPKDLSWTSDYSGLLAENAGFPDRFRATLSVGAGAELRVPGTGLSLRGGYRSVPSPLADAERLLDRTYVSGGIGFDVDANTSLHLTFVRGLWNRTSVDSYTPGGTEERIEAKRLLAGVALRF